MNRYLSLSSLLLILFTIVSCSSSKEYGNRQSRYSAERNKPSRYKTNPNSDYAVSKKSNNSKDVQIVKGKKSNAAESYNNISKSSSKNINEVRSSIVSIGESYIGIKYTTAGKLPTTGFDCSGFTNYVFNEVGINISGPSQVLAKQGQAIDRKDLKAGDLVFFGTSGRISHVGIISKNEDNILEMVHSSSKFGVRKDIISTSEYWNSRFLFGRDIVSQDN